MPFPENTRATQPQEHLLNILLARSPVSVKTLSQELRISPQAVHQYIRQLRDEGFEIPSLKGRGYQLAGQEKMLFPPRIQEELRSPCFGQDIIHFLRVDSTNTQARRWANEGAPEGALVITEFQEKGKGRLNRVWQSPPAKNLLFSLILRPDWPPQKAFYGTVLAAVSLCRTIREMAGIPAGIKWPNDLYTGNKKLAGILTEFSMDRDRLEYMIIGIGLNCNWAPPEPPPDGQPATCLLHETGREVSRLQILFRFLNYGESLYQRTREEGINFLKDEWNQYSLVNGRKVHLIGSQENWTGLAQGIDENGGLVLLLEDGRRKTFLTGDVHLRFQGEIQA
jgi:BirA family transcriptional regulator, biotin operon repressor / biotin---[acetyl-CoA-carboxylase] ligase